MSIEIKYAADSFNIIGEQAYTPNTVNANGKSYGLSWGWTTDSNGRYNWGVITTYFSATSNDDAQTQAKDLTTALSHDETSNIAYKITNNITGENIFKSHKCYSEANNLCPICYSEILTDNQVWINDPIRTPKALAGQKWQGFQFIKKQDITELQNNRTNLEEEVGIAEEDRTVFSPIKETGFFTLKKDHIKEIRQSTDKILDNLGWTYSDYFNRDADGNHMSSLQTGWHDTDLTNYKGNIKAIHIEDLRHPMEGTQYDMYVMSGPITARVDCRPDTMGEIISVTDNVQEGLRCTDGDYIYTLERGYYGITDKFVKYDATTYAKIYEVGGDYYGIKILQFSGPGGCPCITSPLAIACDKNYIYVFGVVHVTPYINEWGVFKLSKSDFEAIDYYSVSTSLTGVVDRCAAGGIAISDTHIYFLIYLEYHCQTAQDPRFWYHYATPLVNDGGEIFIVSINKETKEATSKWTQSPNFGLSYIYTSSNPDELKPIVLGPPEVQPGVWLYYNVVPGIDINYIDIRKGLAIDNVSAEPCLYFHMIERTIIGWKSEFGMEYIGNFTWAVGWYKRAYKRGEAVMRATINEDGTTNTPEIWLDPLERCSLAVGSGGKLHCYGIPDPGIIYVNRKFTNNYLLWDLPLGISGNNFSYRNYVSYMYSGSNIDDIYGDPLEWYLLNMFWF